MASEKEISSIGEDVSSADNHYENNDPDKINDPVIFENEALILDREPLIFDSEPLILDKEHNFENNKNFNNSNKNEIEKQIVSLIKKKKQSRLMLDKKH